MKKQLLALILASTFIFSSYAANPHRGGNGGDDAEMELKITMKKIGVFLNSTVGKAEFKMLSGPAIAESIEKTDISLVSEPVYDRFNAERTCVNNPETMKITCNAKKILSLINEKKNDVLIGLIFHEILGINKIELGYAEQISSYPISSKIAPFTNIIMNGSTENKNTSALDGRSYGVTFVNKKTKESLRVICLDKNVEIQNCQNFSIVKKLNDMQIPLGITSLNSKQCDIMSTYEPITSEVKKNFFYKTVALLLNGANDLSLINQQKVLSDDEYNKMLHYILIRQNLGVDSLFFDQR